MRVASSASPAATLQAGVERVYAAVRMVRAERTVKLAPRVASLVADGWRLVRLSERQGFGDDGWSRDASRRGECASAPPIA
ncbi:MAG: hypothetical protein AAF138_05325 [Planctomycetota bacterium]